MAQIPAPRACDCAGMMDSGCFAIRKPGLKTGPAKNRRAEFDVPFLPDRRAAGHVHSRDGGLAGVNEREFAVPVC